MELKEFSDKKIPEHFDIGKLLADFEHARYFYGRDLLQMNVVCPPDVAKLQSKENQLKFASGTNWDYVQGAALEPEENFTEICEVFRGTYTEELVNEMRNWGKFGRIRFLMLPPKTCLSWHKDPEQFRMHIILKSSEGSFWIQESRVTKELHVERTNTPGAWWVFDTFDKHTAVNASLTQERIHLVFNYLEV